MSDTIGYVIATRNRASGHLAIDWDMEIYDTLHDARAEMASAWASGESGGILRLTWEEGDDD